MPRPTTSSSTAWARAHPARHREQKRRGDLKRLYGITPEQYEVMLKEQDGVCAICHGTNPSGHRLAIDHNHETGQIRGLLCHACNAGIGKLRDNADLLRVAADYIERSTD